jgi:iron complex transport system substrate-binding protein
MVLLLRSGTVYRQTRLASAKFSLKKEESLVKRMERVVSICPSNTELLVDLGLLEKIVGVDKYSDWPAEVKNLPQLGSDLDIDMDKVKTLEPDLVVASLSVPGMERNIERLKEYGLPYIVLNPKTIDQIPNDIRRLGEALGIKEKAEERARVFEGEIAYFRNKYAQSKNQPKLYWEWWPKPIFTPGRYNWLTDVSELVGGVNVFADEPIDNVQTNFETVAARNPDFAFAIWCGVEAKRVKPEMLSNRPEWKEMKAVKQGKVFVLEEGLYCRPSPRLLQGLRELEQLLQLHLE